MTTPAVNKTDRKTGSFKTEICEYGRNGVLIRCFTVSESFSSALSRQVRPASGTSVIRPDKTRAPRGWSHRWGTGVMPAASRVYRTKPNGLGEYTRYRTDAPVSGVMGNSWNSLMTACQAGWLKELDPGPFPYNVEAAARTKFLNKLLSQRMQLGETAAELHKTASLIKDLSLTTARFLAATAKAVHRPESFVVDTLIKVRRIRKRKDLRRWARTKAERTVVDSWLKFQFGVMPVIYDIQSAAGALDLLLSDGRPVRVKLRSGASESWTAQARFDDVAYGSTLQPIEHSAQCHISAVYDMEVSQQRTFQQLGLGNPIALGWQLMPFSWLLDYAVDVGGWLESLVPVDGARFVEGSMTKVYRLRPDGVAFFQPKVGWELMSGFNSLVVSIKAGRMERTVISDVYPALRPAVRNSIGLKQMANALAGLVKLAGKVLK